MDDRVDRGSAGRDATDGENLTAQVEKRRQSLAKTRQVRAEKLAVRAEAQAPPES